jgi:leader peptidase (prepilin peptidase)/N-methyltransferase
MLPRPIEKDPSRPHILAVAAFGLIVVVAVALSLLLAPGIPGVLGAALAVIMLAIVVTDVMHFIVPNTLTAAGFAIGLIHVVVTADSAGWPLVSATMRAATAALAFLGIRAFYFWLRGREGLGLGDVKLAGVAGIWLDWISLPVAIELAAFGAITVYVSRQYIRNRPLRLKSRLPFGAFFAASIWLTWLLQTSIMPSY